MQYEIRSRCQIQWQATHPGLCMQTYAGRCVPGGPSQIVLCAHSVNAKKETVNGAETYSISWDAHWARLNNMRAAPTKNSLRGFGLRFSIMPSTRSRRREDM